MRASRTRRQRRPSPQHEAVIAVLRAARRPLTPSEVQQRARAQCPRIGIATVYRALQHLLAHARVRHVRGHDGSVYYEESARAQHDHLYCTQCGHLHCVSGCSVTLDTATQARVKITGRMLVLFGLCAACAARGRRCRDV